ncbi:MAG: 4-hydroxy-3-methylbut-2-enyl diphosphate reductase [Thermodesulfobacteriota bacterium]|nr:4-hydroxy-3-methylbut-2-enyl diphosphate reductase [Thermodesulfobacteriota bacterium]
MKITVAKNAGFCFGVRRAIDLTFKVRQDMPGKRIFTLGPIIHNPQVIKAFSRRGIGIIDDLDDPRLYPDDIVIIRAHGISPAKRKLLEKKEVEVIDATCPMVLNVHDIIGKAKQTADLIAVVGDRNHPEMDGHLGVAGTKGILIENMDDAARLPPLSRLSVVAQTTFDSDMFKKIVGALRGKASHLDVFDTICRSTVDRQSEVQKLARAHDTFIVIGGKNSANTGRLAEIASGAGRIVIRVESADGLKGLNTSSMHRVAVIAGASTPQWVIGECIEALHAMDTDRGVRNAILNALSLSPVFPALGMMGIAMAALVFVSYPISFMVMATIFFLGLASSYQIRDVHTWIVWSLFAGVGISLGLLFFGLSGGLLIAGSSLFRSFLDTSRIKAYQKSLYGACIMVFVSIIVPLGLVHASFDPGIFLLAAYALAHYLGVETLTGLKNMERDVIVGQMSLARFFGESRVILMMEYTIMGLALVLFLGYPLHITPALAYGLIPPLFFLAKGIDIYTDQRVFDNRVFMFYVQALWLIPPFMGVLWLVTMT